MTNGKTMIVGRAEIMSNLSRTLDKNPDGMSGFLLALGGCALAGPRFGHRVRIGGRSRHFDRQNGECGGLGSQIPRHPAIYPAILRDSPAKSSGSGQSCHFFRRNGRRRTKSGQEAGHRGRIPQPPAEVSRGLSGLALSKSGALAHAQSCRHIREIFTQLEASETDQALREILEKIGV